MPIEKLPVVHKFGIISHNQRLSLEQRLEKRPVTKSAPDTFARTKRLVSEVTDDFVSKFNDSNYDDQQVLLLTANKMLMRAKRRVGVRGGGIGNHVNLPKAWTELTLLAQLNSKEIREESLEVLIASVNQAPLSTAHVPSLFYLAKSVLHWLRKSGLNQPYLRTGELKLLRMGHLVFVRLYHAYQTNQLQGHDDDKSSLLQYLEGVSEQQYIYRSFPGALLALRFITEVGFIICQGVQSPPDHSHSQVKTESSQGGATSGVLSPSLSHTTKGTSEAAFSTHMEKILEEEFHECSNTPSQMRSSTLVECPNEISVTLWHSLDVWRSLTHKGTGLSQAIRGLSICGTGLATESWLDVSCAFLILAHASSLDLTILQTLQALAAGVLPRPAAISEIHARHVHHMCDNCLSTLTGHQTSHELGEDEDGGAAESEYLSLGQTPSIVRGLRDFASLSFLDKEGRTSMSESEDTDSLRSHDAKSDASSQASFADVSSVESEETGTRKKSGKMLIKERRTQSNLSKTYRSPRKSAIPDDNSSSEDEGDTKSKPKSGKRSGSVRFQTDEAVADVAMATASGSILPGGGVEREATRGSLHSAQTHGSSVTLPVAEEAERSEAATTSKTETSILSEYTGLHGWPWELAYLYAEAMTSVALHGNLSLIQKVALLGSEAYRKPGVFRNAEAAVSSGMGLVDLLKFEFPDDEGVPVRDWGWRVRFAAVKGLVRLCRHCHGNSTKDGIRSVAWNALMRHHTAERDHRVLEALKLAQVEVDLDSKFSSEEPSISTLPSRLADSLALAMLPPLPPVVPIPEVTSRPRSRATKIAKPQLTPKRAQARPSLRQEILLATAAVEPPLDYSTRMNTDLMSVIRDQWRKQLHEEELEAEAERRRKEGRRILQAAEKMGAKPEGKGVCQDVEMGSGMDAEGAGATINGTISKADVNIVRDRNLTPNYSMDLEREVIPQIDVDMSETNNTRIIREDVGCHQTMERKTPDTSNKTKATLQYDGRAVRGTTAECITTKDSTIPNRSVSFEDSLSM